MKQLVEQKEGYPVIMKISPKLAAKVMKKDGQFIRIGLQRGLLPFGKAMKGKKQFNYYISPKQFMDYTGASEEEIRSIAKKFDLAI